MSKQKLQKLQLEDVGRPGELEKEGASPNVRSGRNFTSRPVYDNDEYILHWVAILFQD